MAVIREQVIGQCKIYIHDDYIETDPEVRQALLDRVAQIYVDYYTKKAKAQAAAESA